MNERQQQELRDQQARNRQAYWEEWHRRYGPTGDPVRDRARANDYLLDMEMQGLHNEVWAAVFWGPLFGLITFAIISAPVFVIDFLINGWPAKAAGWYGFAGIVGIVVWLWVWSAKPHIKAAHEQKYGPNSRGGL